MTGTAQKAPGSFGAIIQLTQNPSLPIGKAGWEEEVDQELREDWKKGAGSWYQGDSPMTFLPTSGAVLGWGGGNGISKF